MRRNKASGTTVGGIRLKSLVFDDRSVERNDTIYYGYPRNGYECVQILF